MPRHRGRTRRRPRQWHVHAWYCCFNASRCVPFCRRQAKMLCIVAGMHQKDSYVARWSSTFPSPMVHAVLQFLTFSQLRFDFWWSIPVVRVVQISRCVRGEDIRASTVCFRLRKTAENPQLQFIMVVDLRDAEAHLHGPCDHDDSQLYVDKAVNAPSKQVQIPCRGAEVASHGLSDHRVSLVLVGKVIDFPIVQVQQVLPVLS